MAKRPHSRLPSKFHADRSSRPCWNITTRYSRLIQSNWIASATGTRLREQKTIAGMPWLQRIPCAPIGTVFDACDQSIRIVIRLRELSRTEETLGIDLRRCVNQLSQLLRRYFPQLLRLCSTPDEPWLWALLELAPTPQQAAKLTEKRLKQLLAKYRIRRWTAE